LKQAGRADTFRDYDRDRDLEPARRIWREVGWMSGDKSESQDGMIEAAIGGGRAMVAELNGEAESLVLTTAGTVQHLADTVKLCGVMAVTTSRVARKQGLAGRLTTRCMALDAADGAKIAGLGIFEQGFYDRLGYGTGSYETRLSVDPATLRVPAAERAPRRLTRDDWEIAHACRLRRLRCHGSVSFDSPVVTRCDLHDARNGFGLGYFDGPGGALSHCMWIGIRDDVEHGPYSVWWMAYETNDQLVELLGVLKNLGDQVRAVRILEPAGVQLQDLVPAPFRYRSHTKDSGDFDSRADSCAYWQMRILDVPACVAATRLPGADLRFNLRVTDPIERFLDDDLAWRGCGGDYVVSLGPSSGAEPGRDDALPTLDASINAFTRLWLGVRPASGLSVTDSVSAPPELIEALDDAVRLPAPHTDWDF
jgi:hypothetical protein